MQPAKEDAEGCSRVPLARATSTGAGTKPRRIFFAAVAGSSDLGRGRHEAGRTSPEPPSKKGAKAVKLADCRTTDGKGTHCRRLYPAYPMNPRHNVRLRPLRPVRTFLQAQSGTKPPKCPKDDATGTSGIDQDIFAYLALQETRPESWIPVNPLRILLNAQNAAYLNTGQEYR